MLLLGRHAVVQHHVERPGAVPAGVGDPVLEVGVAGRVDPVVVLLPGDHPLGHVVGREHLGQRGRDTLGPRPGLTEVQVAVDGEAHTARHVPLVQDLGAVQADGLGEHQPVGQPALALLRPVLLAEPPGPLPTDLRERAVGDDRGVLPGQAQLVVPAVGDPAPQLRWRAATGVQAQMERVGVPVPSPQAVKPGRELLAGRRDGGSLGHRVVRAAYAVTSAPVRWHCTDGADQAGLAADAGAAGAAVVTFSWGVSVDFMGVALLGEVGVGVGVRRPLEQDATSHRVRPPVRTVRSCDIRDRTGDATDSVPGRGPGRKPVSSVPVRQCRVEWASRGVSGLGGVFGSGCRGPDGPAQVDRPKATRWPSLVPTNTRPPSVAGTENLVTVPSAKLRRSLSEPLTGSAS